MRATTDGPWLWVNRKALALAAQEGPFPALVLIALASIESQTPKERRGAFPASLEQIGREVGISRRAVHQHLQVLLKIGLVTCVSGCSSERGNVRNRYRLETAFEGEGSARGALGGSAGGALGSARGALVPSARGALLYKEKEEEGRPPSGPTRPSSKKETQTPPVEASVRLDAAPGSTPPEKTDTALGDGEDPQWEAYVAQQRGLMAMREQRLAEGSLGW